MLEIINLTKKFDDKILFDSFSYSFPDCGLYTLVGESGVGKTTLLRIIAGLDTDYSGEVIGGGVGRISMAFQEYRLFPHLSALDNIVFAIYDRKDEAVSEEAVKMLYRLGFTKEDMTLRPDELSGGMKMRVSLARAFLKDAPILLLDEPTKELDPRNADIVRQIILELSRNRLVIVVSHDRDDAIFSDSAVILL